jgi:hypothetical protein
MEQAEFYNTSFSRMDLVVVPELFFRARIHSSDFMEGILGSLLCTFVVCF